MDKAEFVEKAPLYYALAIVTFMQTRTEAFYENVRQSYAGSEYGLEYDLLKHRHIFDRAVAWLVKNGVLTLIEDDFGPPIIVDDNVFDTVFDRLLKLDVPVVARYSRVPGNKSVWLMSALEGVSTAYDQLGMTDWDFVEPPEAKWAPLPLERTEPELQMVTAKLDQVLELLRGDNGYAVEAPQEKAFVTAGLRAFVEQVRDITVASISSRFVARYLLEPLSYVRERFIRHALGAAADAAWAAAQAWLAKHGVNLPRE